MNDREMEIRLRELFRPLESQSAPPALRVTVREIPLTTGRGRWASLTRRSWIVGFAAAAASAALAGASLFGGGLRQSPRPDPTSLPAAMATPSDDASLHPADGLPRNGLIAYSQRGRIHIVEPDGTDDRDLGVDGEYEYDPVWSPDGSTLAYVAQTCPSPLPTADPGGGIVCVDGPDKMTPLTVAVMDPDGGRRQTVVTAVSWANDASWRADASLLVPMGTVAPDARVRVVVGPRSVSSPDGTRVAYASDGAIYVSGADGSDRVLVTYDGAAFPIAWLADGSGLVYVEASCCSPDHWGTTIFDLATRETRSFPGLPDRAIFGGWSPDRAHIVYTVKTPRSDGSPVATGALYLAAADGSGARQIATTPVWSPDGTRMLMPLVNGMGLAIEDVVTGAVLTTLDADHVFGLSWQPRP